jgi:hypothetical protein
MAADASGAGGEGAAPAEAEKKHREAYGEWRPTMVEVMTAILTEQMENGETRKFLKRARKIFKDIVGEEAKYLDLGYLARDTLRRMREEGDVRDRPAPGAPPKLTPEKRAEALDLLLKGNGESGVDFIGYASMQAALEECAALRKIAEDAGITARTLRRNLQDEYRERYGKKLKKICIHFKPKLSPEVKAERLAKAQEWKGWGRRKLYKQLELAGDLVDREQLQYAPRYSGDFMQCIEHVHGIICRKWWVKRMKDGQHGEWEVWEEELRSIFFGCIDAAGVQANCDKVRELVKSVVKAETGDYADPRLV